MEVYNKILENNRLWANQQVLDDPDYFTNLREIQRPEIMWIGCSDSRVPADRITVTNPGEIFVHRNISNLVIHTDLNMLSVLQYAVEVLNVKHIIVCGHHNCGGISAAMGNKSMGLMDHWLCNIKDVYAKYQKEIDALKSFEERHQLLTRLNVKEQVLNLSKTAIIQKSWTEKNAPHLHGWVYDLRDGIINPVFEMPAGSPIDPLYVHDNLA